MEKRWLGSIGLSLLLILLVFAVGYSSGNSITGYGFFDRFSVRSSSEVRVAAFCGNGIVDGNEVCDDGNTIIGDGCHNCQLSLKVRSETRVSSDPVDAVGIAENMENDKEELEEEGEFLPDEASETFKNGDKLVGGSGFGALTIDAAKINPEFLVQLRSSGSCETFTFRYGQYAEDDTGIALCNSIGYNSCVNVAFYETGDSFDTEVTCSSSADDMISLVLMRYLDRQRPVTTMNIVSTCCNF